MADSLVRYQYFDGYSTPIDDFEDLLIKQDLIHYTSTLLNKGLDDEADLEEATKKAITVCMVGGLQPRNHFRRIFVCSEGHIKRDWLVSYLGLQLIILNGGVSRPVVARLQIQILSNLNAKFFPVS
jgi:hypothetical protein